jgi:hypothetical protein
VKISQDELRGYPWRVDGCLQLWLLYLGWDVGSGSLHDAISSDPSPRNTVRYSVPRGYAPHCCSPSQVHEYYSAILYFEGQIYGVGVTSVTYKRLRRDG